MAVDDLGSLRNELPDLFSDRDLPAGWEENWVFVKIDDPESAHPPAESDLIAATDNIESWLRPPDSDAQGNRAGSGSTAAPEFGVIAVPDFDSSPSFPGAPNSTHVEHVVPPPDCLAFYLPLHYFHPVWWGVYLIVEGVQRLANFVYSHTG